MVPSSQISLRLYASRLCLLHSLGIRIVSDSTWYGISCFYPYFRVLSQELSHSDSCHTSWLINEASPWIDFHHLYKSTKWFSKHSGKLLSSLSTLLNSNVSSWCWWADSISWGQTLPLLDKKCRNSFWSLLWWFYDQG